VASHERPTADAIRGVVRLSRAVENVVARFDLSVSQFRILDRLTDGSAQGSSLADWLAVKPPSVTVAVDGLVRRGLVERGEDATDRRRVTHTLTAAGARLHGEIAAALAARIDELLVDAPGGRTADAMVRALVDWDAAFTARLARVARERGADR
jgi:DNA-binding MarR family transcriptional regulator